MLAPVAWPLALPVCTLARGSPGSRLVSVAPARPAVAPAAGRRSAGGPPTRGYAHGASTPDDALLTIERPRPEGTRPPLPGAAGPVCTQHGHRRGALSAAGTGQHRAQHVASWPGAAECVVKACLRVAAVESLRTPPSDATLRRSRSATK